MIDQFDRALLNLIQEDASVTAEALSEHVALSPSAIARRLRRLRAQGWIAQTIGLLSHRLICCRLRAIVLVQLYDNADLRQKAALRDRMLTSKQVQFCYETTGGNDIIAMIDCADMNAFNYAIDDILLADSAVRSYETHFVKREIKFAPFVDLAEPQPAFTQNHFNGSDRVVSLRG